MRMLRVSPEPDGRTRKTRLSRQLFRVTFLLLAFFAYAFHLTNRSQGIECGAAENILVCLFIPSRIVSSRAPAPR